MRRARASAICLALAVTGSTLAGEPARTAPYPANTCVGRKQKEAGKYCKAVLRAWSAWDRSQNDRKRDRSLANAAKQLATRWARAEADALGQGTDCAETTLSSGAAQSLIDGAAGGVATAINAGLDLRRAGNARCGSALLNAAALECGRILAAEGAHVRDLQGDADGTARDAARAAASAAFGRAWTAQISAGCPTTAAQADLGSQIDGVTADLVFDTVVSPNVDDTQFTAYPATGTTRYLGRDFTPICMNGSPYYFFAKRGTVNKLVVYYQGGGACWDSLTCGLPSCDATVDPSPTGSDNPNNYHAGFADLANPSNPFRDWNIVFVSYCSCDVHFGDSAKDYPPHVEHRGYQNSRVVEKWAREHFVDPDQVFVTGSSAGAYGAWFNAVLHERVWPASKFEVLADAGNGVITQSFLDNYFPNWNFAANIPTDIPGLTDVLTNGTGIVGYTEVVANFFPRTRWAQYSAAYDGGFGGQTSFYNIMLNDNDPIAAVTWWNASCAFNTQMVAQALATAAAVPSNYRYYIGTGSRHTMWGSDKVYTDTTGGVPTLVDWLNAMLAGTPAWTNVECTNCGPLLPGDPAPRPLRAPFSMIGSDIVVTCP